MATKKVKDMEALEVVMTTEAKSLRKKIEDIETMEFSSKEQEDVEFGKLKKLSEDEASVRAKLNGLRRKLGMARHGR